MGLSSEKHRHIAWQDTTVTLLISFNYAELTMEKRDNILPMSVRCSSLFQGRADTVEQ
jgi:hypothetical protein